MRLLRATFKDFRLLRDVSLEFSSDRERNLTVIRAENETGKTTILNALQWVLYGEAGLPAGGREYRLHPIGWRRDEGDVARVEGSVDFEVTRVHRGGETADTYRITRTATETVDRASAQDRESRVRLARLTDEGADPINLPESFIHEELPLELREVFFTDGDRALSFIDTDVAVRTKRARVESAIRSLLGLGVIEDALIHVEDTAREVNRRAQRLSTSRDIREVTARLDRVGRDIQQAKEGLDEIAERHLTLEAKLNELDGQISDALRRGGARQDDLRKNLDRVRKHIDDLNGAMVKANKDHSALFRSDLLATDLVQPVLETALGQLDELRDTGQIPSNTVPVLEDRLDKHSCICGADLHEGTPESDARRQHICDMIERNRAADEIQNMISELYFGSRSLLSTNDEGASWTDVCAEVFQTRDELQERRKAAGNELRDLQVELDRIPDLDIAAMREAEREHRDNRDAVLDRRRSIEDQLADLEKEEGSLAAERNQLLRQSAQETRVISELDVVSDVQRVLKGAHDAAKNQELHKVSTLMNDLFLEMIGADPQQGAIIERAEISASFDITVYGPQNRELNPSRDLNGASRRALTLAFVLALTNVSGVVAPNVIDTPLGMMSGYVKRAVLRTAIQRSSQLVLFLTRSEINGCEDILDDAAGVVYTLTNPTHYPRILINDPGTDLQTVLRCDCDHHGECDLCKRRMDAETSVEV